MAFLLGYFTDGLFSGASDVFTLYQNYQKIQQTRKMMAAGDEIQKNMEAGGPTDTSLPAVQEKVPAPSAKSDVYTFDDDPELKKMPRSQYSAGNSSREGKAFGGIPALKESGTSPREGGAFGAPVYLPDASPSTLNDGGGGFGAIPVFVPPAPLAKPGTLQPPGTTFALPPASPQPAQTQPAQSPNQAIPSGDYIEPPPTNYMPQPRTTAPSYLPPGAQTAIPAPTAPTLASGQALGAQILAALNPMAGHA